MDKKLCAYQYKCENVRNKSNCMYICECFVQKWHVWIWQWMAYRRRTTTKMCARQYEYENVWTKFKLYVQLWIHCMNVTYLNLKLNVTQKINCVHFNANTKVYEISLNCACSCECTVWMWHIWMWQWMTQLVAKTKCMHFSINMRFAWNKF